MSQNHSTTNGIPGRDQIDIPTLNTMGQYHGKFPWFYEFRAQIGIRYFALQTRVCFVTYHIYHFFGTY